MQVEVNNNTKLSNMIISPSFIWCFLMPSIHLFSLISNILCIIVFCSNIFIKRPIAIYFICLLISDSITLLIGYIEMIDRESNMVDKSSWLCMFNEKIIHRLSDLIYTFMGRFCLEWMLYKVLWTRASTILLAILSIQRSRTFFSLSYHETRSCACFACIASIIIALAITCLEWVGVQSEKAENSNLYLEMYQTIINKKSSHEFYSTFLYRNYNETVNDYPCIIQSINVTSLPVMLNKSNCSFNEIASEFYTLTQSLITNGDSQIIENTTNILVNIISTESNLSNNSILIQHKEIANSADFLPKSFEKRQCYITLSYSFWLKTYSFLHPLALSFNRHTVAIFLSNALPSFIVVLANLLSIKVIFFSKSFKYLKQTTRKHHRKRRSQNDIRAFLVILIESFSIIMISWGIPISLTLYNCRTLYVESIATCPKIKDYLALFLFADLFNSSTNSLLYSLSGKLFRRRFIFIIKIIFTCGRGRLWNIEQHSSLSSHPKLDRKPSNNPSININNNFGVQPSRPGSYRHSERLSSPLMSSPKKKLTNSPRTTAIYKRINGQKRNISDDGSLSISKTSCDHRGGNNSLSELESDTITITKNTQPRKNSQSVKSFIMNKVRSLGSTSSASSRATSINRTSPILTTDKRKTKLEKKISALVSIRQATTDMSISSSSVTGSGSYTSQRKHSFNPWPSELILNNTTDNLTITKENIHENLTSL